MTFDKQFDGLSREQVEAVARKLRAGIHLPDCKLDCGGEFKCKTCGYLAGNCRGASDANPDDCELCANVGSISGGKPHRPSVQAFLDEPDPDA